MSETEYVLVPRDLVAFLLGEGDYDGLWFNEAKTINGRAHPFWWRTNLRACVAASPAPAASRAETVARIIDPRAWEFADRHTPNPIMAVEIKHETRASLEKARLILAALPDDPVSAKDGEGEG